MAAETPDDEHEADRRRRGARQRDRRIAAPSVLPRLNAPMFIAEARLGASYAAVITRTCSANAINIAASD